jgi:chromosome segregation ATPase
MANDLEGRVDKLSEAVAILSERVTRVKHEQRAMRSSIDQLTGEARQLEKRLGDFDKRLGDMSSQFDKRLGDMSHQFDRRLEAVDKRTTDRWVLSVGMGLVVLLMTLYRFVHLGPLP